MNTILLEVFLILALAEFAEIVLEYLLAVQHPFPRNFLEALELFGELFGD